MKKTYIIPEIQLTVIASETTFLEGSLIKDGEQTIVEETDGGWVKGNSSSSSYNVWNDDWSKN